MGSQGLLTFWVCWTWWSRGFLRDHPVSVHIVTVVWTQNRLMRCIPGHISLCPVWAGDFFPCFSTYLSFNSFPSSRNSLMKLIHQWIRFHYLFHWFSSFTVTLIWSLERKEVINMGGQLVSQSRYHFKVKMLQSISLHETQDCKVIRRPGKNLDVYDKLTQPWGQAERSAYLLLEQSAIRFDVPCQSTWHHLFWSSFSYLGDASPPLFSGEILLLKKHCPILAVPCASVRVEEKPQISPQGTHVCTNSFLL